MVSSELTEAARDFAVNFASFVAMLPAMLMVAALFGLGVFGYMFSSWARH